MLCWRNTVVFVPAGILLSTGRTHSCYSTHGSGSHNNGYDSAWSSSHNSATVHCTHETRLPGHCASDYTPQGEEGSGRTAPVEEATDGVVAADVQGLRSLQKEPVASSSRPSMAHRTLFKDVRTA